MDTDSETIVNDTNEAGTVYVAWLTMTEDMIEGKMSFEISGYEDLAGNVGDTITTTTNNTSVILTGCLLTVRGLFDIMS